MDWESRAADLAFLAGSSEMAERTRSHDWGATPVGSPQDWPQSLKTAVGICLGSRHPIVVWWGNPEYTQFYNDAYISFLGAAKHPDFLGRSGRDCWSEIWAIIGPMLEGVFRTGEATWSEDLPLVLHRHLPQEEAYFTFSYSPIRDDAGAIRGIFCACIETTDRVIRERRLRTLRDLGRGEGEAKSPRAACEIAARTLAENSTDMPFALIYLLDDDGGRARLICTSCKEVANAAAPPSVAIGDPVQAWPLDHVLETGASELVSELVERFGPLPGGPWPESPEQAVVVPIAAPGQTRPTGFLISGLSPRRVFDADYGSFLDLVAGHIGTSIANARAYEAERKRAEALAELDRAKTTFFSNVSHEFRTPLTLMLGPLEELLKRSTELPEVERDQLELVHRSSLRLLKLVNTLLDFSRIEAGRMQATYEPVDLARITADLASVFRSLIERAGIKLLIECHEVGERVYVDREMWEKIVLNLISNAFKFTFEGEISVSLTRNGSHVEMSVRDTGTGIPENEIPRLFERFHRVNGARGRSHEGSGIGLALVQELAHLHGGTVRVESRQGRGSVFTVMVPLGTRHLPTDRIQAEPVTSTTARPDAYVEEALSWLPETTATLPDAVLDGPPLESVRGGGRIVLAEDNSDMRDYVRRLLTQAGYEVEAVADGGAALAAVRRAPADLVLADVMMPGIDGFGLLRALRADPALAELPIMLLSARAGEEARIEGLHEGADDYLIKPFSSRELLARVEAQLKMARLRRDSTRALRFRTEQFETLVNQAPLGVFLIDAEFRVRELNSVALKAIGPVPGGVVGRHLEELAHANWHDDFAKQVVDTFRRTLATGEPYMSPRTAEMRRDRRVMEYYEWRVDRITLPDGRYGAVCYFRDISEQVQAEDTRQLLINELNHRVKNTLANVQAIAQQTLHSTRDPADFADRFSGRIQSLARVHTLLSASTWQGASLEVLIQNQLLLGTADESRVSFRGPAVQLDAQMSLHLALMLHELGTNSVKHGALSTPFGQVVISWQVEHGRLELQWIERGGPEVRSPTTRGFGTTLIEGTARADGGEARMLVEADGISWQIALPLSQEVGDDRVRPVPNAIEPTGQPASRRSRTALPLAGWRILLVEDEPLVALDFATTLTAAGAEVRPPVGTEREALLAIEEGGYDAALLDANLHGQSVAGIAASLARQRIPFLFVTGYSREALPASFRHATMLAKPFESQQLVEAVSALARRGESAVQLNR